MKTHSFINRGWGHDFSILTIIEKGQKLKISGWRSGITKGDTLLLPNGADRATYRVEVIRYQRDPRDQFFADLTYVGSTS